MKSVSVMVVDDSAVARQLITDTLNSDPRISVVCAVDTGEEALRLTPRLTPDVISMDVRLPGMSGIEATRRIMAECPTPIIVVAADLRKETIDGSMEALRAGALSVVEKPAIDEPNAYRAMARRLCDQFVNLSAVKVVRQRFNEVRSGRTATLPARSVRALVHAGDGIDIVGVVASTGGPPAVASLLQGLGPAFPVPILLVQHMGTAFLDGYAAWLDSVCDLDIVVAHDGEALRPGRVYVGPGHHHLTQEGGRIRLVADRSDRGHIPSGDRLLASLAANGVNGIGVVLTGMGEDGAAGLLAMRRAGAHTIGQDRATCAVYGMPAAALALGAVMEELPLTAIARRIAELVAVAPERDARRADRRLSAAP